MAHYAARPAGHVDAQEVIFIKVFGYERARVAAATTRFDVAIGKSDLLQDDDSSAGVERVREKTLAEEARLTTSRGDLKVARGSLEAYGMAVHGAQAPQAADSGTARSDDEDAV